MLSTGPFGKLFIVHRFAKNDILSKLKHFDNDERTLLNSLSKKGLKNYLENDCNLTHTADNQEQKDTIMQTRNLIITNTLSKIMCHYPERYELITSYKTNQTYYHRLFNINQLVIYIFQFFNDVQSLVNCSMVDSIWLINAFHSNCIKNCTLNTFNMKNLSDYNEYYRMRQWLRFAKISTLSIQIIKPILHLRLVINNLKWINFDNMNTLDLLVWDNDIDEQLLQQLTNLLSFKVNRCNQAKKSLLKRFSVQVFTEKILNQQLKVEQTVPVINASRYKHVRLTRTQSLFQTIVGQYCEELVLYQDIGIDFKQSNFSCIRQLHFRWTCVSILQQFLKHGIYCPKLDDLNFDTVDQNALIFWKKHQKYLQNNNGKVSLRINIETLLKQNSSCIAGNINNINSSSTQTNYIQTLFTYIKNNRLSYNINISKLSVRLFTDHQFNLFRDALMSTTDFKCNIERLCLDIDPDPYRSYDFCRNMGWTQISKIFFDKSNKNHHDRVGTFITSFSKMKYFHVSGMNRCNVENVLDLLTVLPQRAKIIDTSRSLLIHLHLFKVLCTNLSSMTQLLDLIYHIVVVIRYPVRLSFDLQFDKDHFEYDKQLTNIDKVMKEMKRKFDSFEEKIRSDYEQPLLQGLNCIVVKVPDIHIEMNFHEHSVDFRCNTSSYLLS